MKELSLFSPIGSIESYISHVSQIPRLDSETEMKYAIDYYENGNNDSAKMLILSNLRFVVFIAYQLKGYNAPIADMIQEGNIGLMKAIKTFNPYLGIRLISHAAKHIKYHIYELVRTTSKNIKLFTTKAQKKIFFNIAKHREVGKWLTMSQKTNIANQLNVSLEDVEIIESNMYGSEVQLNYYTEDGDMIEYPFLADEKFNPVNELEHENELEHMIRVKEIADTFNERDKDIFYNRMLSDNKQSLEYFAKKYNVSFQRIEQLEKNIIKRLKKELTGE